MKEETTLRFRAVLKGMEFRGGTYQPMEFAVSVVSDGPFEFPDGVDLQALLRVPVMVTISTDLTERSLRAQSAHDDAMAALGKARAAGGIGFQTMQDLTHAARERRHQRAPDIFEEDEDDE